MYAHFGHTRSFTTPSFRWLAMFLAMVMVVSTLPFAATLNQQHIGLPTLPAQPAQPVTVPTAQEAGVPAVDIPALERLPVAFVANAGQSDTAVHFQAHTMGGVVYFANNEVVMSLPTTAAQLSADSGNAGATAVRMQFHGSSADVAVSGVDKQGGVSNYLYGSDSSQWITNVANYGSITYESIYPGINLRYDGTAGTLKSTYTVAAGANPANIRWSYAGATGVSIDKASGNLHIGLAGTSTPLVEEAPIAWQNIGGSQVPVAVDYTLTNGTVGFALGSYNPAHALIIDPAITYATYVGGGSGDAATGLAVDEKDGYVYVTGWTESSDFATLNPLPNYLGQSKVGQTTDIFIRKIDVRSNELVYSTYMGGDKNDYANAIALGKDSNVYITGFTDSPMYEDEYRKIIAGTDTSDNIFAKSFPISPTSTKAEGTNVVMDPAGTAYGYILDEQADGEASNSGAGDAFVAKLTPEGDGLVYSSYLGGSAKDEGLDIAVYASSEGKFYAGQDLEYAYVTGSTASADFPVYNALPGSSFAGTTSGFLTRVGPHGKSLQYSTYIGGSSDDISYSVAVAAESAVKSDPVIYLAGQTKSTDIFTWTNSMTTALKIQPVVGNKLNGDDNTDNTDAFVTRIISASGQLSYTLSTYLGGVGNDVATGVAVDNDGNIYVSGYTNSTAFSGVGADSFRSTNNGGTDAFVSKLNNDGTINFSSFFGGTQEDRAHGIAVDDSSNIYLTGQTRSSGSDTDATSFPTKELTPQQEKNNGSGDAFITKFNPDGKTLSYSVFVGGDGTDVANDIVVLGSGNQSFAFIAGETQSNTGFPITEGSFDDTYNNGDGFIAKVGPPRLYFAGYDTNTTNPTLNTRQPKPVSEGSGRVTISPELSQPSSTQFDINLSTRECGEGAYQAKAGTDFTAVNQDLTIAAGSTSISGTAAISVTILDDTIDQVDGQIFCMDISSGFGETQALTITIGDNDGPNVSFAQVDDSASEPGATATSATTKTLQVKLSAASPEEIRIPVTASEVNASGSDYTLDTTELVFSAGTTQQNVALSIANDNIKEVPEDVQIVLGEPLPNQDPLFTGENVTGVNFNNDPATRLTRATVNTTAQTATVTIEDNAATPKASIGFVGTSPITYEITLGQFEDALGSSTKSLTQPVTAQLNVVQIEPKMLDGQTSPTLFGTDVQVKLTTTGGSGVQVMNSYTLPAELAAAQTLPISVTVDPDDRPSKNITLGLEISSGADLAQVTAGEEKSALLVTPMLPRNVFLPLVQK